MADVDPVEPEPLEGPAPKLMSGPGTRRTVGIKVTSDEPAPGEEEVEPSMDMRGVVHAKSEEPELEEEIAEEPAAAPAAGKGKEPAAEPPPQDTPAVTQARKRMEQAAAWADDVHVLARKHPELLKTLVEVWKKEGRNIDPETIKMVEALAPAAPPAPARLTEEQLEAQVLELLSQRKFMQAVRLVAKHETDPQLKTIEQRQSETIAAQKAAADAQVERARLNFVAESFAAMSKMPAYAAYIKVEAGKPIQLDPAFNEAISKYCEANKIDIGPDTDLERIAAHALLDMGIVAERPQKKPALDPNRPRVGPNRVQQVRNGESRRAEGLRKGVYRVNIPERQNQFEK